MDSLLSTPTIQYCEIALDAFIARPWYALSNVAFVITGVLILRRKKSYGYLFGSLVILIGGLSFAYDASYTYISQLFDIGGMLLLVCFLLYLNLQTWRLHQRQLIVRLATVFVLGITTIFIFKGFAGNIIFGLLVIAYILSEVRLLYTGRHSHANYWVMAFSIFTLGFIFWLLDASHMYCVDIGLFNGRAIFHYTSAAAIYMLFKFYGLQLETNGDKSTTKF